MLANRHFTTRAHWLSLILCVLLGCHSPYYADRGAALGGLAGAGLGAAIGSSSDNTVTGAVLGTAAGAATGSIVGNEMDAARAEQQHSQAVARQLAARTTHSEILAMTKAGLGDNVIANHVRTHGLKRRTTTNDLIQLKNEGVSETVLMAIQQSDNAPPMGSPVVVEEHYHPGNVPFCGSHVPCAPPFRSHWYTHRRRPGFRWGVSVSH